MEAGRSSRCPSLGCSTLGAEHELIGEDSNEICLGSLGIVLPLLEFDLPLYIEVGWVHGGSGEFSLSSIYAGV